MKGQYISSDELVKKTVIQHGKLIKPQDGSVCSLLIEDVQTFPEGVNLQAYNSDILTGNPEITMTVGESLSEVDRQIERAVKWMGESEVAVISVVLSPLPEEETSYLVKLKVTLTQHKPFKPIWQWTPEEKFDCALKYKVVASDLMKRLGIKDAFHRYSKAVKIIISMEPIDDLELDEEFKKKISDLRLNLYNNMAMCQLKCNNYDHTITLCTKVLQKDENNVKALYRRGCAYGEQKNVEKALNDFQRAYEIEPFICDVRRKFLNYQKKWTEAKEKSDDIVKKMFSR